MERHQTAYKEQKYVLLWQDKQVGTTGFIKGVQPALRKIIGTLNINEAKVYVPQTAKIDIPKIAKMNSNLHITTIPLCDVNKISCNIRLEQIWETTKTVEYSLLYDLKFKSDCSEDIDYYAILMKNLNNGLLGWYKSYDKKAGDIEVAPRLKSAKLFRSSLPYLNTVNALRANSNYIIFTAYLHSVELQ